MSLIFTFSYKIHLKLIFCMWCEEKKQGSLFSILIFTCSRTICKEYRLFPLTCIGTFVKHLVTVCVWVYFQAYYSATWISPVQQCCVYHNFMMSLVLTHPPQLFLFFKIIMSILGPLRFHMNFRISSPISTINLLRFWMTHCFPWLLALFSEISCSLATS